MSIPESGESLTPRALHDFQVERVVDACMLQVVQAPLAERDAWEVERNRGPLIELDLVPDDLRIAGKSVIALLQSRDIGEDALERLHKKLDGSEYVTIGFKHGYATYWSYQMNDQEWYVSEFRETTASEKQTGLSASISPSMPVDMAQKIREDIARELADKSRKLGRLVGEQELIERITANSPGKLDVKVDGRAIHEAMLRLIERADKAEKQRMHQVIQSGINRRW